MTRFHNMFPPDNFYIMEYRNRVIDSQLIAVQNKTLIDKNLSKQVDVWKICYVEKSMPSPTFLTVLDEMWE